MQSMMTQLAGAETLQEALNRALQNAERREHQVAKIDHQDRQLDEEEQWTQREVDQLREQLETLENQRQSLDRQRKSIQVQLRDVERQRNKIHGRRRILDKQRSVAKLKRLESEQMKRFEESLQKAEVSRNEEQTDSGNGPHRQHPRLSVEVPVSLHTEHNFFAGISRNISSGGLFVATYEPIPIGTVLETAIHLANGETLRLQGRVVWQREYNQFTDDVSPGVGIQFSDLTENDCQAIARFMTSREPLLYEAE